MRLLVTGTDTFLGAALARRLAAGHDVQTMGSADAQAPTYVGDGRDRDLAARAVADRDAVIHIVHPGPTEASDRDLVDLATRGTYNLLTAGASPSQFILITSLCTFESYPSDLIVNEQYAPRPTTDAVDLASYLSELAVREVARSRPIRAIALRMGEVVDDDSIRGRQPDPRWLHVDDAFQAVERALSLEPDPREPKVGSWSVFHIVGAGIRTRFPMGYAGAERSGYKPRHDLTAGVPLPIPARPPRQVARMTGQAGGSARRVVLFGSNGPFGAVTAQVLARDHVLRLASRRPVQEVIAQNRPQGPGAPLPSIFSPPHEHLIVDIARYDQVLEACRGMDGMINCTVERGHPVHAFLVNTIGAYNLARAAVECGIRRLVQTGPEQVRRPFPYGYEHDYDVPGDAPVHSSDGLYAVSKYLGQEILRVFAEEYDLEVPVLLWNGIHNPATMAWSPLGPGAFWASWEDTGQAIRAALHAPSFPHPYEVMNIAGDLPHGRFSNERAKRLLGWQPRDSFEHLWRRRLT